MDERGFERFAGWCACATGVLTLGYALSLALGAYGSGGLPAAAGAARLLNPWASLLMFAAGLLATPVVWAVHGRVRPVAPGWANWAASLGLLGAVMMAAHGLWDYLRVPALLVHWESGNPARQDAVRVLSSVPNALDPRGLGALLFIGLFAVVAGWMLSVDTDRRMVGRLGLGYGALLVAGFAVGLTGFTGGRVVLLGLAFGILGPLFWIAVGRTLLAER